MQFALRPYQEAFVEAVDRGWGEYQRQLGVMATGCGKTLCFATLAAREAGRGSRTMVIAHRDELLDQARDKILKVTGLVAGPPRWMSK